jgi:lipopolysaccharide transport system permease protein
MHNRMSVPGIFLALWRYRSFIASSVAREFRLRYTGSVLGVAWNLLHPLALVSVYVVVFGQVMRARLPGSADTIDYSLYVLAGMLVWLPFAEIIGRCVNLFTENANLLKKAAFPRVTLLASAVLSSLVNFAILTGVFVAFLVIIGRFPGWITIVLLAPVAVTLVFGAGLGILLGTLNVLFRDVGQFTTIALQFWFWFTPIVYPLTALPEALRKAVAYNPLSPPARAFQDVFVHARMPDWQSLGAVSVIAVAIFALGYALFKWNAATLVDEL